MPHAPPHPPDMHDLVDWTDAASDMREPWYESAGVRAAAFCLNGVFSFSSALVLLMFVS